MRIFLAGVAVIVALALYADPTRGDHTRTPEYAQSRGGHAHVIPTDRFGLRPPVLHAYPAITG